MNALESAAPPLDIFADFSAAPTGASVTGELAPAGIRSVADVPVMAAYLCLIALFFVVINLAVDLLYYAVDPRLRIERTALAN